MNIFEKTMSLRFRQTDMAGVGYFNETFNMFHDAYEEWVASHFESKEFWFNNPEWAVPLRHAGCDYQRPLMAFEEYTVRIAVKEVGNSTFQLESHILKGDAVHAVVSTTHIFLNKESRRPQNMPDAVRRVLTAV